MGFFSRIKSSIRAGIGKSQRFISGGIGKVKHFVDDVNKFVKHVAKIEPVVLGVAGAVPAGSGVKEGLLAGVAGFETLKSFTNTASRTLGSLQRLVDNPSRARLRDLIDDR